MKKNIAFLFGAGVSIPSKIKKTSEITNFILEGKNIVRSSAESYFLDNPERHNWSIYSDAPKRVQSFLKVLRSEFVENLNNERDINYEDIFYLLDFINRNHYKPNGNPFLKYILKDFQPKIKNLLEPLDKELNIEFNYDQLLNETNIYIKDLVTIILSQKVKSFDGLKILSEYILENPDLSINIFTLNHDTVIEQFFESKKINYNDGFEKYDDDFCFWKPELFDRRNRINLYKIHGSVNWHFFDEYSWADRRICKVSPQVFWREPKRSVLLIGTDNKLYEYIRGAFLELYYRFYKNLLHTNFLIVSGYSFGDAAINEKLFDWVLQENNKMIIIDPCVDNLKFKMRFVLNSEWDKKEKIIPIQEYSENITWSQIKEYLN